MNKFDCPACKNNYGKDFQSPLELAQHIIKMRDIYHANYQLWAKATIANNGIPATGIYIQDTTKFGKGK